MIMFVPQAPATVFPTVTVAWCIFTVNLKDMGEGLIPIQYGHLQFIFQGHQPVTDLLTALRQFGSPSVAAPILGKRRQEGSTREVVQI